MEPIRSRILANGAFGLYQATGHTMRAWFCGATRRPWRNGFPQSRRPCIHRTREEARDCRRAKRIAEED